MSTAPAVRPQLARIGQLVALPAMSGLPRRLVNLQHVVSIERLHNASGDEIGSTVFLSDGRFLDCCWTLLDWMESVLPKGGAA